jgi:flavin reductase (DIM6/NTAB) family NADH-FMN oxidoreductase RutF
MTDPQQEQRRFRNACGKFTTGVTVVSAAGEQGPHHMTANAFMSVSLDPMLIAVALGKQTRMNAVMQKTDAFMVSVLASSHQEVSDQFAGRPGSYAAPRFMEVAAGVQALEGCLAWFSCRAVQRVPAGDHDLVIGEVLEFWNGDGVDPLIFFSGKYFKSLS